MSQSAPERIASRQYSFPVELQPQIENALRELGFSLFHPGELARAVKTLSDFYLDHPSAPTPWGEKWARAAYLAYFFPLNWARSRSVVDEARRAGFLEGIDRFVDYGSGLSAFASLLEMPGLCVDISVEALKLHKKIATNDQLRWSQHPEGLVAPSSTLGVFSYVYTELKELPPWAREVEALLIVEPSTREDGRRLLALRRQLMSEGFSPWAPCTHRAACPLLEHSKSDWCHDRIHFHAPDWFLSLEKNLPMKNRTITFSYLLMRRKEPKNVTHRARLIGDQLIEKGKTRQMVCKDEKREFLSWLHRNGEAPPLKRGYLVELPDGLEIKSDELRVGPGSKISLVAAST